MMVRSWPVGAGTASGATRTKRVWFPAWSSIPRPGARGRRAWRPRRGPRPRRRSMPSSATSRAPSAVEVVPWSSAAGSWSARKRAALGERRGVGEHPPELGPARCRAGRGGGGGRRGRPRAGSRRSSSPKTSWSRVAVTEPSIEFSSGTNAASTAPEAAAATTSAIVGSATSSERARSGSPRSASSVKVPAGARGRRCAPTGPDPRPWLAG